ncbi:MAG: chemotaxis protein CheW [Phenylobacterium sp.]|uniref:chemotaxis protein CheW n=1 Tax=Phenylobacterium sp. TaxID=1871053 RepID=UPI0039194B3F
MAGSEAALPAAGAELVTVAICGQHFAVDIMAVREIRGWTTSTPLPHAPSYVLGMINLRGAVLPVVDLGLRLGLQACARDSSSVVIVAHIGGRLVGLLVDEVCDILTVSENMLQQAPDVGAEGVEDFVRGVLTTDDGIVTLLTLDGVLPALEAAA